MSDAVNNDAHERPPAVPGDRLREAREARGLSRQAVAERLCIDTARVAAMESGDLAALGAPVFAAGYVRVYARLLDLPSEELLQGYRQNGDVGPAPTLRGLSEVGGAAQRWTGSRRRGGGLRTLLALLLVVLLGVGGGWWLMQHRVLTPSVAPTADAVDRHALSLPVTPTVSNAPKQAPSQPSTALPAEDVPAAATPATVDTSAEAAPATSAGMAEPESTPATDELTLSFSEDSWAELYDGRGERLLHRLARGGEKLSFVAPPPFKLVVGYMPGVQLQLNGTAVDLSPYRGRRLARFTVGGENAGNEN